MKLEEYYKYRSAWMGVAILWVMMFHIQFHTQLHVYEAIAKIGYAGCDIFLFASGLGIYYSLDKDPNLATYMKRRIIRLAPMCWLALLVWLPFMFYTKRMTIAGALGNIIGLQFFFDTKYDFNWYIPILIICYVFAPFFKAVLDIKINAAEKNLLVFAIFGVFLLLMIEFPSYETPFKIMGYIRVPAFFLGMCFGSREKKGIEMSRGELSAWLVLLPVGIFVIYYSFLHFGWNGWKSGLIWWPFLISIPGFCFLISLICNFLNGKLDVFVKILEFFGRHSLEIYLAHAMGTMILRDYYIANGVLEDSNRNWAVMLFISIIFAVVLYWINYGISKILDEKHK